MPIFKAKSARGPHGQWACCYQFRTLWLTFPALALTCAAAIAQLRAEEPLFTPQVVTKSGPPVNILDAVPFTDDSLRNGIQATEAECRQVANGVWAATAQGDSGCLRVWTAGFTPGQPARRALVFFSGDLWSAGRPISGYSQMTEETLAGLARGWAARLGMPYIFIARPGTYGSSGDHMERRRPAESRLVSGALDVLKARLGIAEYVLVGYSGGGHLTSALVTLRADIVCAVPGAAPSSPRLRWQLHRWSTDATGYGDSYEPTEHLRKENVHPKLRILVVGDPRDRNGLWPAQVIMAVMARAAGIESAVVEVQGTGPDYHGGQGDVMRLVAGWCAQDVPTEEIVRRAAAFRTAQPAALPPRE